MSVTRTWNPAKMAHARRDAGLSQEALAARITKILRREAQPVRSRNVVRWERPRGAAGAHTPHSDFIPAIAEATGKDTDFFFDTDDEEEDPAMRMRRIRAELVLAGRDDLAADLLAFTRLDASAKELSGS